MICDNVYHCELKVYSFVLVNVISVGAEVKTVVVVWFNIGIV